MEAASDITVAEAFGTTTVVASMQAATADTTRTVAGRTVEAVVIPSTDLGSAISFTVLS